MSLPDLDDYKLHAEFDRPLNLVLHRSERADWAHGRRKVVVIEKWAAQDGILGAGSFGTVHLQRQLNFKGETRFRERAVKQLRKSDIGRMNVDYRKELLALVKFSREKFVQSQAFVEFLGWFEDDEHIHIAMEYFPQGTLDKFIRASMSERDVQIVTQQLLEGLRIMHEEQFTHRDLKPQNIFVVQPGPNWWVKIGDFGVSKRVPNHETALRTATGTPLYSAPEIFHYVPLPDEEDEAYTNAVDVWAVACVVYQMLALTAPFVVWPRSLVLFCHGGEFPAGPLIDRASPEGIDFIKSLLVPFPTKRPSAKEALKSSWLKTEILDEADDSTWDTTTVVESHGTIEEETLRPPILDSKPSVTPGEFEQSSLSLRIAQGHTPHSPGEIREGQRERKSQIRGREARRPTIPGLCNSCHNTLIGDFHHCSICENGRHNLCASCVEAGRHCWDQNHWLVKRNGEQPDTHTEILRTQWALLPVGEPPKKEAWDPPSLASRGWRKSYPTTLHQVYDYCYHCRITFRSDDPPHRHEWELHGTVDRPVEEHGQFLEQKIPGGPNQVWGHKGDHQLHKELVEKLRQELELTFQQKKAEKELTLKNAEDELYDRHKSIKAQLMSQLMELQDKKSRLEAGRGVSTMRKIFSLR